MEILQQSFSVPVSYPVFFTRHLFDPSNPCFRDFLHSYNMQEGIRRKILFVADEGMLHEHAYLQQQLRQYFQEDKQTALIDDLIIIPGGEAAKNDEKYFWQIIDAIDRHKIDRHSYVVAIGGGALLDLAGYAAAVAHRGVKHIRIPTTVLSQNDSGIGVKNGINYHHKKNFLGTFTPPIAVFNDAAFLASLCDRDWRAGIAEAIKVALIKDADFFDWLEKHTAALPNRNSEIMQQMIYRCAGLHLQHIASGDPFESGSSRPLDFGHWSAHKLEAMTDFALRHGEAVAIGMALDIVYAFLLGWLPEQDKDRALKLIVAMQLPVYIPELEQDDLISGLQEFREHLGGQLTILQLKKIGYGENVHDMDLSLIKQAIGFLKQYTSGR